MIAPLRHLLGWMVSAFGSREALILENLALRQQLLALRAKRPRRRLAVLHKLFWVVFAKALGGMENAAHSGHPSNGGGLASGWLPAVLEVALKS
jgi:hypothetical protein